MRNEPRVEFTPFFDKQRKQAPLAIKEAFQETVALFLEDPDHPTLRNHELKEKFAGYRSIDVTPDVRAVFKQARSGGQTVIVFHLLGTHKELYG
jgi:mRNA-degrading endonuclease YafQ of YafQ-DinJ toxin-antitoxin module